MAGRTATGPAGWLASDRAGQSVQRARTGLAVPVNAGPTAGGANGPAQPNPDSALLSQPALIGTVPDPFHGSFGFGQPLAISVAHPAGLEASSGQLHLATLSLCQIKHWNHPTTTEPTYTTASQISSAGVANLNSQRT